MTREEAVGKCHGLTFPGPFVQALEALGLLKVEEPKTPIEQLCAALNWGECNSKILNETLAENGLKVVRA